MALSIAKKHISKNRKSLKKNTKIHWDGGLSNLGKKSLQPCRYLHELKMLLIGHGQS
jgi:hypothetical protein